MSTISWTCFDRASTKPSASFLRPSRSWACATGGAGDAKASATATLPNITMRVRGRARGATEAWVAQVLADWTLKRVAASGRMKEFSGVGRVRRWRVNGRTGTSNVGPAVLPALEAFPSRKPPGRVSLTGPPSTVCCCPPREP